MAYSVCKISQITENQFLSTILVLLNLNEKGKKRIRDHLKKLVFNVVLLKTKLFG
ncbi:hypothetical protein CCAND95_200035 [Capnocytophaga canis]|uniref:Uncharacterized protein n=1 Tax=Capnocytophaga canis TaxID=1848903 RepID=A0A0B7IMC0_9FLAO|nr:hypothetical protein CCAND95_200035 [Capnocytophaga canis]CEN51694.1 hypothetical protein CCAND93_180016 [Capnocytophaga canis]